MPPVIRPYRAADREAVHEICVRTGHQGGDARGHHADPLLLPLTFAAPYLLLEPELAFVLDDGGRVVGYVLGAEDTAVFVRRYRDTWLPEVTRYRPPPAGPPTTPDEIVADLLHRPERMLLPELDGHPAHLHIDLLPSHQRRGHGRRLMDTLLTALGERGVPAVHLGMVTANTAARAFYDRLGFEELPVPDPGPLTYLGRTVPSPPG
ncbi:GNAT family N-acetyltransferase [Kitasatospora sp. NPDC094015]|uniref:GNAT family N-acetyltransferase n=1 Tax=Kitasatospora sp. NPDC094015 TaxID=3155205 RepID=UPI0033328D03